jgi:hypothetical protein
MARPKESIEKLPQGWQSEILELYKEGGSDVEVKALIYEWRGRFSNDLWDRWLAQEPEFSEIIKNGRGLSEAWWTTQGRVNLQNNRFNHVLWYMNMKNRFNWTDKQQMDHTGIPTIPIIKFTDDHNGD